MSMSQTKLRRGFHTASVVSGHCVREARIALSVVDIPLSAKRRAMSHSAAYDTFLGSMRVGFPEWHDGIPYDLDALDKILPSERALIERKLVSRRNKDWRDSEALGRLGTEGATKALIASTTGSRNREVRLRAGEILRQKGIPVGLDDLIVDALRHSAFGSGLSQALELTTRFPSEAIERTLLHGARCAGDDEGKAIHFTALLLFLHGKAAEPFDQTQQPFFQRFHAAPGPKREQVFRELCERIGVQPSEVPTSEPFPRARKLGSGTSATIRVAAALAVVATIACCQWFTHRG